MAWNALLLQASLLRPVAGSNSEAKKAPKLDAFWYLVRSAFGGRHRLNSKHIYLFLITL
jgi:hypothetical protein